MSGEPKQSEEERQASLREGFALFDSSSEEEEEEEKKQQPAKEKDLIDKKKDAGIKNRNSNGNLKRRFPSPAGNQAYLQNQQQQQQQQTALKTHLLDLYCLHLPSKATGNSFCSLSSAEKKYVDKEYNLWKSEPALLMGPVKYEANLPSRGGGRGFVAPFDIPAGTVLMREQKFLSWPSLDDCDEGETLAIAFVRTILSLEVEDVEYILNVLGGLHPVCLEHVPPEHVDALKKKHKGIISDFLRRFAVLCDKKLLSEDVIVRLLFALQYNGFSSGIYLHLAIFNHSCAPNCIKLALQAGQKDSEGFSEVRAMKDIPKGSEFTISYLDPSDRSCWARQRELMHQFEFECACSLCAFEMPWTLQAMVCEVEGCTEYLDIADGKCRGCGASHSKETLDKIMNKIEDKCNHAETLIQKGLFEKGLDEMLSKCSSDSLHPLNTVGGRCRKLNVQIITSALRHGNRKSACIEFSERPENDSELINSVSSNSSNTHLLLAMLSLCQKIRLIQLSFLGRDHIDHIRTLMDLSQVLERLMATNPKELFYHFKDTIPNMKIAGHFENACRVEAKRIQLLHEVPLDGYM
eukprot:Nk52_evm37s294 gene=Nk52_evmTU37s294